MQDKSYCGQLILHPARTKALPREGLAPPGVSNAYIHPLSCQQSRASHSSHTHALPCQETLASTSASLSFRPKTLPGIIHLAALQLIRDVMSKGQAAGLNVIRAWATSASPNYALQTSPGNFSEAIFRGLDYALDQARQQNLKVKYHPCLGLCAVEPHAECLSDCCCWLVL